MSDHEDSDTTIDALQKEVERHKKARAREKTARLRAEELLEISSRELFQAHEEQVLINQQLKQTQSQMVHQEKMAGLGQLAAGVAHEINNPVGFVMSNLSTLGEYVDTFKSCFEAYEGVLTSIKNKDSQQLKAHIKTLEDLKASEDLEFVLGDVGQLLHESVDGAVRVKDIVSGLRDFARLDEAEVKEADINEGIESTLNVIWNAIKYKAEVVKELGEIPLLVCYPAQLNQVFMNLLTNAAQAMDDRGEIRIRTYLEKENIIIEIRDAGKGIEPEHLGKIFDPLFTTKSVGAGTGLGLAISHGIIEKHNGKITVQSEIGNGSIFTISLPTTGGVEHE